MLNPHSAPILVGRDSQLAMLRDFVARLAEGTAGTLVVQGDAGAGKTRLVGELTQEAGLNQAKVLVGGCVSIGDEPLRHAALIELLRADRRGPTPAGPSAGVAGLSVEEMLERLLAVVDGVTPRESLAIVVEDLHWADRGTCEILTVLARHVAGRNVGLVLTCREEIPRDHHVRRFLADLRRGPAVTSVAVPALTASEVARLVETLLGDVDPVAVASVFERSGGNPLLVEELCAAARGDAPGAIEGPLRDILLTRIWQLSEPARDIVRAVAVAGSAVHQSHVAAAVDLDEKEMAAALREALDRRVLVLQGASIAVRHVLMAEAVYAELLAPERTALHTRWAQILAGESVAGEAQASEPRRHDVLQASGAAPLLAYHWYEAGAHEPAFDANLVAAEDAAGALAFDAAHRYYRNALSLWDQVDDPTGRAGCEHGELVVRTAETANWAGDPVAAVAVIDAALANDGPTDDPGTASVMLERRAWYLLRQGEHDAATRAYVSALEGLPATADAARRAHVLGGSVRAWERAGDFDRALALAREAVAVAEGTGDDAGVGPARYMLGRILLSIGDVEPAIDELDRSAGAAEAALNPLLLAIALLERGDALARHHRLDEGVQAALAVADRLRRRGHTDPHALLALGTAAALLHRLGRPSEGRIFADTILQESSSAVMLAVGHLLVGAFDVERVALGEARDHLETARLLAAPLLEGRVGAALATSRAELALAEGNVDGATSAIEEGIAGVVHTGDDEALAHLCLLGLRIEAERASVALGRDSQRSRRRRDAVVEGYERRLTTVLDAPPAAAPRPDLAAIRTAWRAERGRLDGAADPAEWRRAVEDWSAVQWPRWAAYSELQRAEALARSAAPADAVADAFRCAQALADAIASPFFLVQVAQLAHRAGVVLPEPSEPSEAAAAAAPHDRRPAAGGGDFAELTRREREVLDLVAAGATNRQIATRLFISEKTASVHVSRILTKLGATNRQEAASLARRAGSGRRRGN